MAHEHRPRTHQAPHAHDAATHHAPHADEARPLDADALAFVRAHVAAPPLRLLEIGAGDGQLAAALRAQGYEVTAIDPGGDAPGVLRVALLELPDGAPYDAAFSIVALHHVEPLEGSLDRLARALKPGARLVLDEFDVERVGPREAQWLLDRRAQGAEPIAETAAEVADRLRQHVHTIGRLQAALAERFEVGPLQRVPYLNRWALRPDLRGEEEQLIARGELAMTGVRFVAVRAR